MIFHYCEEEFFVKQIHMIKELMLLIRRKISIILKDKGFLSSVYKFNGKYETRGLIFNNSLMPLEYKQNWITKKKERSVNIVFKNGSLNKLFLFPEEKEHSRIQYIGIKNFLDPLSSFLNLLMGNNQSKTIDRSG